jgi:uncharacterized protein
MKYAILYESADDVAVKAPAHLPDHVARLREFHARGELVMVGTFEDPLTHGAMGIFQSREAAEEFIAGDPFVLNGVIRGYEIRGGTRF